MSDIYSFYQLISKYQIEIPIIQRDYAQGRNNSKAADVRKSLVDNMIKAVKEEKSLFFDFVYGRVDNNKFIPFDGQQRLTTLFLFHKYVFEKCQSDSGCNHKDNCSCRGILDRFSYATRQSSREFCKKLVENNIIPDDKYKNQLRETFIAALKKEDNEKEKKADEFIKSIDNWIYRFVTNQSWFYPDWEKDPTVMGMLTILDEIHCQMRNETDFKTFAEKLTSGCNCPITFHFVDMGEHKMSDETYVKMNARGKTLTPFENFKASLEQYLEEKSKSENLSVELQGKYSVLLCRLKGEYDKSKQKYTGIDGSWLDLFWEVTNKEKQENEGIELPDSLMMSFFNRHFMNVWRNWYANNPKSETKEKDDVFNTRIQKEMPLYPTKDDFVPFDIYEYVIDKCQSGVDVCLSPIFDIWDALCVEGNTIETDCRSNWNQWNLYYGDKNKDNRETYPSRVAFYALLRFFGVENEETKTTLSQWMRVVWNIIENSTIDSSDTYHAALRLIDNLSEKCHDIHDALANHFGDFELGSQYHAQEQVKEEIAKANQILNGGQRSDGKSWEKIIIEAEKYAFFKGAIRFLFTDGEGNINWCDFDTKWGNAKKYFDGNGVKNVFKVQLIRGLVIQCVNWNEQLHEKQIFNTDGKTWKWILTAKNWTTPIHNILMNYEISATQENNDVNVKEYITPLLKDLPFEDMINTVPNGRFKWYKGILGYYYNKSDVITFDWVNFHRNSILRELKLEVKNKKSDNFWWGWDIQFTYNNMCFQWHRDGYVRLIKDIDKCEPIIKDGSKEKPVEKWYCFYPDAKEPTKFTEKLNRLINEVKTIE